MPALVAILAWLSRIGAVIRLLVAGLNVVLRFLALFGRLGLWIVTIFGAFIGFFVVPKTWWQYRIVQILDWITGQLQPIAQRVAQLVAPLGNVYEGSPIAWAGYYCDLGLGLQIFGAVLGLWAIVLTIKVGIVLIRTIRQIIP